MDTALPLQHSEWKISDWKSTVAWPANIQCSSTKFKNSARCLDKQQEVKVIWQKAPHGGPIPRLGVTPGGRNLYHWIPGVGVPISLATVHARDNQRPTTNDVMTQPISINASFTKVKWGA